MSETPRAVALLSGGLDSTTLVYLLKQEGYEVVALSVLYGQRHRVELTYATETCRKLGIEHRFVDFGGLRSLVSQSSLTSDLPVPEGHYAAENMAQTVVPNRNAILLAVAYGLGIDVKATKVCTAVHAGDHAIYPDCRPGFIKSFEEMEREAITREIYGMRCPSLYAPFVLNSKAQIIEQGHSLGVSWVDTWSCYQGGSIHCGRCGTCVERIGAFNTAGIFDPTEYLDLGFAESVLREKGEWVQRPDQSRR